MNAQTRKKELIYRYKDLAEAVNESHLCVFIADKSGKICYANRALEELFKRTVGPLVGANISMIFSGGDVEAKRIIKMIPPKSSLLAVLTRLHHQEEKYAHFEFSFYSLSEKFPRSGYFLGIGRKLTEFDYARSRQRLNERFLLNILRDSADAIIAVDLKGDIISWSKGAEFIFGYSEKEMVGENIKKLLPKKLLRQKELKKIEQEVKDKGYIHDYITERIDKNNRPVKVNITQTGIKDEKGKLVGYSVLIRDITEIQKLEEEVIHAARLAATGEVAASLAHEIKNPLMGISAAVQILMRQYNQNDRNRILMVKILEQVKRVDSTVNDLLRYARPKPSKFIKSRILPIIKSSLQVFQLTDENSSIKVNINSPKDLPSINLDPEQIGQVFVNVILNAIQAMENKGVLTISISQEDNFIKISFKDTGKGVPEEIRNKIFNPFFTTKHRGTGLGLSIAKRIVEAHNGKIILENTKGKGATFSVFLPINRIK